MLLRQACEQDDFMFFDLRNEGEGMSLEEIAEQMGYSMSKVTDLFDEVNQKIIKVIPLRDAYFKKYCKNMENN